MINHAFWEGKRVLVTGHTGFKGSWLSLWLQSMGAKVVGYSLPPPTNPSMFETARVMNGMVSIIGDVRELASLQAAFAEHKPEIVIHMAAQPLVRYSYTQPVETYATNVMGTVNVLEAVRQTASVRVVLNVTSDKCYENREWVWGYRENEPMGGHDPYSSSKGCAELVTAAFQNSYFNNESRKQYKVTAASARAGNVIGGGDWAHERLVPDLMKAIMSGDAAVVRNPHAIRPWQHVLEPLTGYLLLVWRLWEEGPCYAEGWNFGPDDENAKPVSWIADRLTAMWGNDAVWRLDGGQHPHEANLLKLDCAKAKARLGWRPKWDLETALQAVVDWHRALQQGTDMRLFTLQQIQTYQNV